MVLNGKLTLTETGITFVLRRENGKKYVQYSAEWCEVRRALLRDLPRRRAGKRGRKNATFTRLSQT